METIKLVKVKELKNATHPNNRPVGEETIGFMIDQPKVGSFFLMLKDKWGREYFRTSLVVKIISKSVFETLNSRYKIIKQLKKDGTCRF